MPYQPTFWEINEVVSIYFDTGAFCMHELILINDSWQVRVISAYMNCLDTKSFTVFPLLCET